jgi:hypothetical protein
MVGSAHVICIYKVKEKVMKLFMFIFFLVIAHPLWAGCESSILEGSHTAIIKKEAKEGAWEDAKEVCYPGAATKISIQCKKVKGDKGVQGKKAIQCTQEVSCNICGDNLTRKYEALN